MGTRNLTAVFIDGKYRVAQYGQWDGYPEGQGMIALHFIRDKMEEEKFKSAVRNSSFIGQKDLLSIYDKYGVDEDGFIKLDDAARMYDEYPELSRDIGAKILEIIQNNPDGLKLKNNIEFAADSLYCKWAWVIDFDRRTFEAYEGFNQDIPLKEDDRFSFLNGNCRNGYFPVRKVAQWKLDNLPDDKEFLSEF